MAKENNLVLIDADSMIYIIGSEFQNMQLEPLGEIKLDEFIKDVLISTGSKEYIGFVGGKGRNFRLDIAVTKPYKGTRAEKPEWFEFWGPILKKRMIEHWGFQECCNIEADDACIIARNKYEGQYNKITIATPDKDLLQRGDTWFYDYLKRTTVYCTESVSVLKYCYQLIFGDSTDNIPGCAGAGKVKATEIVQKIAESGLDREASIKEVIKFYKEWYSSTLKSKQVAKQEKEYLVTYKKENGITKLTKEKKSKALKHFVPDLSMILTEEQIITLFEEQTGLVKMLDNEEDAAKYGFILGSPTLDTRVDWDKIEIFQEEIENMVEEHFDFEEYL